MIYAIAFTTVLTGGATVAANDLELAFSDGRVTVIAKDVTIRAILEEWSRVGNTRIVDTDVLTGQPVRLQLVDVPEADALRVLLREAAGYMAAPRTAGADGSSRFDRVVVMATARRAATNLSRPSFGSSPPQPVPVQRAPGATLPGVPPGIRPEEIGGPDIDDEELEELRGRLPQPFSLIDRTGQNPGRPGQGETSTPTASRPGVVVNPTDDQPAVFIRRPVQPQTSDDSRR